MRASFRAHVADTRSRTELCGCGVRRPRPGRRPNFLPSQHSAEQHSRAQPPHTLAPFAGDARPEGSEFDPNSQHEPVSRRGRQGLRITSPRPQWCRLMHPPSYCHPCRRRNTTHAGDGGAVSRMGKRPLDVSGHRAGNDSGCQGQSWGWTLLKQNPPSRTGQEGQNVPRPLGHATASKRMAMITGGLLCSD